MAEPSDRDLVLRSRRGDADAFGTLVRRYQQSVFNVCYRLMGNRQEAEDMVQESFVRAYERLHTFDVDRPFGPWMRTVATNHSLNQLRRRRYDQVPYDDRRDASTATDPLSASVRSDQRQQLRAAIQTLPDHQRAVIELRHYQELRYEEIAQRLDLPLNTVKSHLFRARRALAQRLESNE